MQGNTRVGRHISGICGTVNLEYALCSKETNDEELSILAFRYRSNPIALIQIVEHPNVSVRTLEFIMKTTEPKLINNDANQEYHSALCRLMECAIERKKEKNGEDDFGYSIGLLRND